MLTLEVDINRVLGNIAAIKRAVNARIYAVVKADAYGHGAELCGYIKQHVYGFAVSCRREAVQLLNLGVKNPILMLCPNFDDLEPLPKNVIHTVCDFNDIKRVSGFAAIKVNTGMNRLGFNPNDVQQAINAIKNREGVSLKEIFTHFYSLNGASTQLEAFNSVVTDLPKGVLRHCCASTCMALEKRFHLDAVRCGLAIYGYGNSTLKPAMTAYTQISQINAVKKGQHTGYGDSAMKTNTLVAVLKAGYADGIKRTSGQKVAINGKICDIIGNVCMDMCMANISGTDAKAGDRAYFINDTLNAEVIAKNQNTVTYEVLTSFSSKRINRIYKYKGEV